MVPVTALPLLLFLLFSGHLASASAVFPRRPRQTSSPRRHKARDATRTAGDYQTYNTGLGNIYAPSVTKSGSYYYSSGQQYNFLIDGLNGSCYYQMNLCQLQANQQGNTPFAVSDCNGWQIQACLSNAQSTANGQTASSSSSSWSSSSSSSSSSSKAASAAPSSSLASSSTSSSAAAASKASASSSSSTSSSSASASPTASAAAGNYQTYTGFAGGIVAPAVTQSGGSWYQSSQSYNTLYSALQQSCYAQASSCSSSSASFDHSVCWGNQVNACLAVATSASNSYTTSAAAYSSSVASANYAAATMARTVSGDLQTYTEALGGYAAPAVTGTLHNWVVAGISGTFYNLIDALSQSCYAQQTACGNAAAAVNYAYEMTTNNCYNVQVNACLSNAQNVANNWSASSSTSSSAANTASNAAASASSASAYAASVSAAAASSVSASYAAASASAASASAAAASASAASAASASAASASVAAAASSAAAASVSAAAASASAASASAASASAAVASASLASSRAAAVSASAASSLAASISASAYAASSLAASVSVSAYMASSLAASVQASAAAYTASSLAASASAYAASSLAASAASYTASSLAASAAASASAASAAAAAAAAAAATAVPSGWIAKTCIAEGTTGRALVGAFTASSAMTWKTCTDYCTAQGFPIAGIEYSSECYCGLNLINGASLNLPSTQCNMPCGGSPTTICGGPNAITLFVSSANSSALSSDLTTVNTAIPAGWAVATSSLGICIQEGTTGRALAGAMLYDPSMTIAKCIGYCGSKGMQWAGLEYGSECWCGNDLVNGASLSLTSPCGMPCGGNTLSICGGPNMLSVFKNSTLAYTATKIGSWAKQGCIQEVGGRALTAASLVSADMTVEKCTQFCTAGGYAFAGLEYSAECYCGNKLVNGATLGAFSTQCYMSCAGNSGETCGGPNAISLYSTLTGNALVGA